MDEQSKDSLEQEIDNAEEVISKLKTFTTELDKKPDNILTHLCDGLETFLGFNKDSKGYDGSGIVYSDLDRLCDAVMGFLSGVLEGVKDDEAVKKYDGYIERETDRLDKLLKNLTSSIGKGSADFRARVTEVSEWLDKYWMQVDEQNNGVTNELNALINNIESAHITAVDDMINMPLADQLDNWTTQVRGINTHVCQIDNFQINKLDSKLRKEINEEIKVIKKSVEMLHGSAVNEKLKNQVTLVDSSLKSQEERLNKEIVERHNALEKKLEAELHSVLRQIGYLSEKKSKQFKTMTGALEAARKDMDALLTGFEGKYRNDIIDKFDALTNAMSAIKPYDKDTGKTESNLKQQFKALTGTVTAIGSELDEENQKLNQWKIAALQVVQVAEIKVGDILKIFKKGSSERNRIEDSLRDLCKHAQSLRSAASVAKQEIETNVSAATEALTKLDEQVKLDITQLKAKFSTPIDTYFKKLESALKQGASNAGASSTLFPQNFYTALDRGDAPLLRAWAENKKGVIEGALNGLDTNGHFPLFKSLIEKLEEKHPSADGKSFFESIGGDIKTKVQTQIGNEERFVQNDMQHYQGINGKNNGKSQLTIKIKGITTGSSFQLLKTKLDDIRLYKFPILYDDVDKKLTEFTDAIENLLRKKGQNNTVNTYLTDMGGMINSKGSGKYSATSDIGGSVHSLTSIYDELGKLRQRISQVTGADSSTVNIIIEKLEAIPGLLEQARHKAIQKMDELKRDLKQLETKINSVDSTISDASADLEKAIKDVRSTLYTARETLLEAANDLKENLLLAIYQSFSIVTATVRTLFATERHADLKALKKLVTEQETVIKTMINDDKITGVKGFLIRMKGDRDGQPASTLLTKLNDAISVRKSDMFKPVAESFQNYLRPVLFYVGKDSSRLLSGQSTIKHTHIAQSQTIFNKLNQLLDHVASHHFDGKFSVLLDELTSLLGDLAPSSLSDIPVPVLEATKKGLTRLYEELGKAYINMYSGHAITWEKPQGSDPSKAEPTEKAKNCAKVFFTLMSTVKSSLTVISVNCKSLGGMRINNSTDLGKLLAANGFIVSDQGNQNGELQDKSEITGEYLDKRLAWPITQADNNEHLKTCESKKHSRTNKFRLFNIFDCIFSHIEEYNEVCHLSTATSTRVPCSIYEMLGWFSSLPYNKVYEKLLSDGFTEILEKPKPRTIDTEGDEFDFEVEFIDQKSFYMNAHPKMFTYKNIDTVLGHLCSKSYDVLTTIAGHGDSRTVYGSDYCNNFLKLKYPTNGVECLHTILDLLRRLLPSLRYLHMQCRLASQHHGWGACRYGRDVTYFNAQCDTSTKHDNCHNRSPLMSYLNDCLPGHLPHHLTSVGCKSVCNTCPKSMPGQPCLTPLGFRGFSGSIKTGKDISNVISDFLAGDLLSCLFSLVPKPPSTLPEHYAFASYVAKYFSVRSKIADNTQKTLSDLFNASATSLSIKLYDSHSTLTGALTNAYGSESTHHNKCDQHLINLTSNGVCSNAGNYSAPYLYTLCSDSYKYLAHKHADVYLSWAVCLPWDLHKYLENLLETLRNIFCRDWGCSTCLHGGICRKGEHGVLDDSCKCASVVSCKGVSPTLYKYGFTFANAGSLIKAKKNCFALCTELQNVIRSTYFTELFKQCDEFIFTIRQPFIWLNVALWSLSLFYLICVMVGRLDVLHIRSHLRIPSSHKITAQSLLAAAQVGRLAKISYLQP